MNAHRRISRQDDGDVALGYHRELTAIRERVLATVAATEQGDNAFDWLARGLCDVLRDLQSHMDDIPRPNTYDANAQAEADLHAYQRRAL